ncbi:MAG: biopolymer transporter ExbD [Blastocatellia bacterium]|nr:biopolymer transporter ExbD [Blastocatellia bacterium]
MGMSAGGSGGFTSEINVTPMVDVMLVLLIIFMVVTPMLQSGVTVVMPKAKTPKKTLISIKKQQWLLLFLPMDNFILAKN